MVLMQFVPLLGLLLRVLVHRQDFWRQGLQAAAVNANAIGVYNVVGYSRPDRVKQWDRALAEFALSGLHSEGSLEGLMYEMVDMWTHKSGSKSPAALQRNGRISSFHLR